MQATKGGLWVQVRYSFWSDGQWHDGLTAGHADSAQEFEKQVGENLREEYGDLGFVMRGWEAEPAK
jgi:hypothetical protein